MDYEYHFPVYKQSSSLKEICKVINFELCICIRNFKLHSSITITKNPMIIKEILEGQFGDDNSQIYTKCNKDKFIEALQLINEASEKEMTYIVNK